MEALQLLHNVFNGFFPVDLELLQCAANEHIPLCYIVSFRTPEPRFSSSSFPVRSSYGQFPLEDGMMSGWRRLGYASAMDEQVLIADVSEVGVKPTA